uniref:Uncharacterized protein n=1 Tax=Anguilla anguilla TaxID=7936 RepID=A0A0E9VA74_ANGAN
MFHNVRQKSSVQYKTRLAG